MAAKKRIKSPYCTNCGKVLQEEDNFCPNCGQENDNKRQSFGHVMTHLVLDFLHFDSRIFKSLPALIFRPGFLTKEYLKGRRQNYLDPVKMFITIVVIYFLLSSSGISKIVNQGNSIPADSVFALNEDVLDTTIQIGNVPMRIRTNEMDQPILWYDTTGSSNNKLSLDIPKFNEVKEMVKRGKTDTREILDSLQIENTFWNRFIYGESIKLIKSNFDGFADYMISKLPWIIFCIIPIFALLLKLLYVRRKFLYIDHLVFSFHLHSFVFVMLIFGTLVELWSMPSIATWLDIGIFIYIPFAFKNFYTQGWLKTLGKLIILFVTYIFAALFFFILALIIMFLMY